MTRTICVITGSRADYGHLQPVMAAIKADPDLTLQTLVCGQHLDPRFGETSKAIDADGFTIDARVAPDLSGDSNLAIAQAAGRTVSGVATELSRLAPDIVLVLGDRYEILAASVAALLLRIPIAHIHGGEVTEAAFDDSIRHALSKMAALHFVAAKPYGDRLIQMGEDAARVIVSGAPGLDDIATIKAMDDAAIARDLGIAAARPLFVVTYHPVTLAENAGDRGLRALLDALAEYPDAAVVFTGVNSDPGHAKLRSAIDVFVAAAPKRRACVTALGRARYLSLVKAAAAVIGNSSSGLIEAPPLLTPTVNIGDRQKGRLRSATVIDCPEDASAIADAIQRALDPAFRDTKAAPAYGGGGAAGRIAAALREAPLAQLSIKRFHDIIPAAPSA
jgi:UDP-hydrolysing UDP-N-acetyl-D-glucosamine 2-epimerase